MAVRTLSRLILAAAAAVAALCFDVPAGAAFAAPLASRPGSAPAATVWSLDKAGSRLTFQGSVGGQTVDGVFKRWDAQIAFDPRNLRGSHASVTIDVASLLTGDPLRDQMLPGPDWFNVAKYPSASFVADDIVQTGPGRYQAAGELKIRGTAQRVMMPFTLVMTRDRATLHGALTLDRLAFGVGQGRYAAADPVARRVVVQVRLTARAQR